MSAHHRSEIIDPLAAAIRITPSAIAYIDTIELFLRYLPEGIRRRLEAELGKRLRIESCDQRGRHWGFRLIFHQPGRRLLALLDDIQKKHGGKLCRVDVAFDFDRHSKEWFEQHCVMNWRRPGWLYEEGPVLYYIEQKSRSSRSNRDLVLYNDKRSKITKEPVTHLELRFYGTPAVRREGWLKPTELLRISPKKVAQKHLTFIEFDPEEFKQSIVRSNVKRDRLQYRFTTLAPFADRYWAGRPLRIRRMLEAITQDRAQLAKDIAPERIARMSRISHDVLQLPSELSWVDEH